MTERVVVVAGSVERAKVAAAGLDMAAIPVSPRSVRMGAGRGYAGVAAVLVDGSAWPLDQDIRDCLEAYCAPFSRISGE